MSKTTPITKLVFATIVLLLFSAVVLFYQSYVRNEGIQELREIGEVVP